MINLIGISGKINAGKDLVGSIIQYLYWKKLVLDKGLLEDNQLVEFSEFTSLHLDNSNFKIRKFGAKLKQIVALLIGCTVEDLESQEFKSSPLGKEWNRFYYYHYKLRTDSSNGRVSPYFSTYEEAILYEFPKLDGVPIWGKDSLWIEEEKLTSRLLLQLIGTEGLRNLIHPNCHINGLFADYIGHCNSQFCLGTKQCPDEHITKDCNAVYPNWIITDTRFPNELQAIKERNGIVIRINRDSPIFYKYSDNEVIDKLKQMGFKNLSNIDWVELAINEGFDYSESLNTWKFDEDNIIEHESETALDNAEFDYVIDNNSDIPHLIEEVRKMLVHFKIL